MKVIDFKDAKCRHCYKCVRNCRVKAIAIRDEQAHIIQEQCINCGHCLEVCPQNAKTFSSDLERIKGYFRKGYKTVVSIAPSYLGVMEFNSPGQIVDALLKLGFDEIRETAEGAAIVTNEYKKLIREKKMKNIITTCCPSMNDLVEKYYPDCTEYMAPVVSPMIAHGRYIKKIYGDDTKVIFLGPCIAKKQEAVGDERLFGAIDAILTFEELNDWLLEEKIDIYSCDEKPFGNPDPEVNRLYPVGGGVITSVMTDGELNGYHRVQLDGLDNCMEMLECLKSGGIENCFIEANICDGGCIKGPASAKWNTSYVSAEIRIEKRSSDKSMQNMPDMKTEELTRVFENCQPDVRIPTEEEIQNILKETGKYSTADELNCGACGYQTCREKAAAVFNGKAENCMCLPYTLMQSESMSNIVLDVTPDAIFIVNSDMKILECNKCAQELIGAGKEEALQRYIFEFIESEDIEEVFRTKQSVINSKIKLDHGRRTMRRTILYIENMDCVLVTFHDITREEKIKEQHYNFKLETMEIAQKVIDKQMMAAQEIASLLGETTAETKVTMTKLRNSILEDDDYEC